MRENKTPSVQTGGMMSWVDLLVAYDVSIQALSLYSADKGQM